MKSFTELTEAKTKRLALLFGRINPPTKGHETAINGLKRFAAANEADHIVVVSHSHDAKNNPLETATKVKHLKRAFPDTNIEHSSKEKPTILHQAAAAYKKGYTHLHVAAGDDRVEEFHKLLHHYNGVKGGHGVFKFKKIEVKTTGPRQSGISGTDARKAAETGDYASFKKQLPSAFEKQEAHAKELYKDTRKGLGITENTNRGLFKAIFVSGGPGSGKDLIIREAIAAKNAVEINPSFAAGVLRDKTRLHEQTRDVRKEALRNRLPLIINGTTAEHEDMLYVKEELEELGYQTLMIFVNTTNEASRQRNEGHVRVMSEAVRQSRWENTQIVAEKFNRSFGKYLEFDNSLNLTEADVFDIAKKEEDVSVLYEMSSLFLDLPVENDIAIDWLAKRKKLNINTMFELALHKSDLKLPNVFEQRKLPKTQVKEERYDKYTNTAEVMNKLSFRKFRESIDSPETDLGATPGAGNKEPLVTPLDKINSQNSNILKKRRTKNV